MKTIFKVICGVLIVFLAFGLLPASTVMAATSVPVYVLAPSWSATGGGGVYSAYIGPPVYGYVSPGLTTVYDGRAAGIIKAGLAVDPTSGNYEDEGLFGFIPSVTIDTFAIGPITYDVETQYGENPVWMTIEIDTGVVGDRSDNTTYQYVPTTNPAGWHTVDAAAGLWQKWNDNNGDTTGNPLVSINDVAIAHTGLDVVRAYLRLGMGNSYHGVDGLGTVAWVDKVVLGAVTYDFEVFCTTECYVSPAGSDSNPGTEAFPFLTIQKGIDSVSVGGTVNVLAGTYVLGSALNVNKDITLNGVGSPLLQVSGTGERIIFQGPASDGATLQGFSIEKTDKTGVQNIIYIGANNLTIQNNTMWGQFVIGDGDVSRAMVFTGGLSGLLITNNEFYGLRQPGYISGVTTGVISNNYTHGTKGWVVEQGNMTFTNNTWGSGANANVYDIAILATTSALYYTDIPSMSGANNDAFIEDQRTSPATLSIVYVDGSVAVSGDGTASSPKKTIPEGITRVVPGGTVYVAAGTYQDSLGGWRDLEIKKSLSLIGAGKGVTIVEFSNLQHGLEIIPDAAGVVTIDGFTFTKRAGNPYSTGWGIIIGETGGTFNQLALRNIDIGYASARNLHFTAAGTYNNVTIENSDFHDSAVYGVSLQGTTNGLTISNSTFNYNGAADPNHGYGLAFEGNVSNIIVTNSHFDHNFTQGINATRISNALFDGITADYNGDSLPAARDVENGFNLWDFSYGSHDINITNSSFSHNQRSGIVFGDEGYPLTNIEIESSTFDGNGAYGIIPWVTPGHLSNLVIHHNRFVNSPWAIAGNPDVRVNAENNWWGCNEGPGQPGCTSVGNWGSVPFDYTPWLTMSVDISPAFTPGDDSTITANLKINSAAVDTSADGYIAPAAVNFTPTAYLSPDSVNLSSGLAASVFSAPVAAASFNVCAVLDNESICSPFDHPTPLTVYVDISWAGATPGDAVTPTYPAGAPVAMFGYDAFASLQDALAAIGAGTSTTPSMVYVDAGTYSGTGTILINKNWVTIKLATGAVIQNASPCFTVAADYVTIQADSLAGARCVPTSGSDGIIVTGTRRNLTLEKFEILGTNGDDGVYFDGVITDLVIADLYIHDLTANGILFDAQPAGILDIHGNMFRDNAGNGIEAGAFTVPAEFNSWGDYDGPAGTLGDGASAGVDFTPWTHVNLFLQSSGTPWANQVVNGQTITYTVYGDLQNVVSADFTLLYPSNLTYVSSTGGGNFNPMDEGSEVLTHSAGQIRFIAYKYGAGVTGHLPLFTATFTGSTVGISALNLDDTTDGFGMTSSGSSTNIYAYELVDGSVTVIDLPVMDIVPTAPYIAGLPIPFTIDITNVNGGAYTGLALDFTLPAGAILEYWDGAGWVPATDPFTLGALAANGTLAPQFQVTFVAPGTNTISVALMDTVADPDYQLATATEDFITLGNFTVLGTFSMQGRTARNGIPVTLTKSALPIYGPFTGTTINVIFENLTIENVNGGTYTVTTLQPRYLNVVAANLKTILVNGDKSMAALELRGGNAQWADNIINIQDAGIVGSAFGTGNITSDGDVNFDNVVNVQDLGMIGGNWGLTSETAYGIGNGTWVPLP